MPAMRRYYNCFLHAASRVQPAVLLAVRLWMAHVFFAAGLVKIGDWQNTIDLFTQEYHVPILPPVLAAAMATIVELTCPVLLTFGFATRLAVLPMLAMTAVIQFTYDSNIQHLYWALSLATLLAFGAGCWSVDALIAKKYGDK